MQVIRRAYRDTVSFFGLSLRRIVVAVIVYVTTFLLLFWWLGKDKAIEELTIAAIAFVSALLPLVVIFLWNLWLAPYRIMEGRLNEALTKNVALLSQPTPAEVNKKELLKMMGGVSNHLMERKEPRNVIGHSSVLDPKKHHESLKQARRVGIWKRKLADMGFYPDRADDEDEKFAWEVYLEWIIPCVEEYGIDGALKETRRIYKREEADNTG